VQNLIKFKDFSYCYGCQDEQALHGINLQIDDGEFVLISGPSGSGKSSIGRCLNGLIPHFYGGSVQGSITVQGLDVLKTNTAVMAARVGMVFQDPENQIVSTSVEREIAFGPENLAYPAGLIARRIEESLDTMGIFNLRGRDIKDLSGGEKQKVAIAAVLALHPEILVLDEPTSELDPQSAEDVLSIVKRLNDELGITVVMIEHRLDRLIPYIDRLIIMDKGCIALDGGMRRILAENYDALIKTGVGAPPVVRLAKMLNNTPAGFDGLPLTVKEGRLELKKTVLRAPPKQIALPKGQAGQAIIRIDRLHYSYPSGRVALKNINLEIYRGELAAIMGRNASGKSTLVRHLNGLLKPTRGQVLIDGVDTRKTSTALLASKIGLVFQNPDDHLFADTVENEVGFALKNCGFKTAEIQARVEDITRKFGLEGYLQRYPRSLSGGEKQRVVLASVLATRPEILVLDEPTRGMQQGLKDDLMGYLKEYRRTGGTVILVSHDVETVAEYADRVILLSEGELVTAGSKYEVLARALLFSPQINRLVQSFSLQGLAGDILTPAELARAWQ
jgi:energy-coupling factor transport system ATP-binding protein